MDSDLLLHTGFLVAAAAALAHLGGALPSVGTRAWNPLSSRTLKQWSLASSAGPDIFLASLLASCVTLVPSDCLHAATHSPLPGI